ncbi:MAG: hypothetical protein KDA20_06730 [Phycisphaerales bacterium]|nr:hypothetical protein [Phycisphaerales bacterium]
MHAPRHRRSSRSRLAAVTLAMVAGGALAVSLAGCAKPLFPKGVERTQFDRYDLARNTHQPAYIEDEFGRRTPNLKGRLAPRN